MDLFDGRYEKIALIGKGAFAEVWQAFDTQAKVTLALKIFTASSGMDDDGIDMLTREFTLMIDADHQNLLRPLFFGISQDKDRLPYLTLPFCKNGNIYKMMGKMTEREAWKLIRDTASALAYLHAMNPPIIHQDIKPANILIGNDGYYKLSDFGVSIQARSSLNNLVNVDNSFNLAGTISYMAPEKFSSDTRPIMANDIWSLGAMVFEMLTGDPPFGNDGGLIQKKGADVPLLQGDYSQLLKQTLEECLQDEPWKRPIANQLKETAIYALSKAPTVKMMEDPVINDTIQPIGEEETIRIPRHTPKTAIIVAVVAVLALIGALLFFLSNPTSPVKPSQEIKPPTIQAPAPPTKKVNIEKQEVPAATVSKPQSTEIVVVKEEAQPKKEKAEPKTGKLDLGYAVWDGKSSNGKPDGYGTMTFKTTHRIDSRDPEGNIAQSGDKVKGNYIDGHLEYGTWIKSNGEKEDIFIGQ